MRAGTRAPTDIASAAGRWQGCRFLRKIGHSHAADRRLHADTPERYRELSTVEYPGDSFIIDPRGEIIAGPAQGETILVAEGSAEALLAAKSVSDIGGHYSRPDLLQQIIDRSPQDRVVAALPDA